LIATEFLRVIADYLLNDAGLNPVPESVGIADPVVSGELPAIVLSLTRIRRLGNGLGERSQLINDGALPWTVRIDLANPVLPEEPSFRLLSADRRELILPHGGLVRADGSRGPLLPPDLSVSVAGNSLTVVDGIPAGNQVRADPQVGRLFFATQLPEIGNVTANYFLGQWEQRVSRIAGMLRVSVRDTDALVVRDLSAAVVDALEPQGAMAVAGLKEMNLITLGNIQPPDSALANSRARVAVLSFEFELQINRPESSGGIILRIPVEDNLDVPAIVA
jgi:hypothetical protein